MYENRRSGRIFGIREEEVIEEFGDNCITSILIICALHGILFV
jgi:hypothetical protein